MNNITIADMLKIVGHTIESTEFEEFVSVKMKISRRHARRKIKRAAAEREIEKSRIDNTRIVLYGLAEFGPPENYRYKVMYFDCGLDELFGEKPQIKW